MWGNKENNSVGYGRDVLMSVRENDKMIMEKLIGYLRKRLPIEKELPSYISQLIVDLLNRLDYEPYLEIDYD
jgi:hypothetical protein